MVVRKIDNQVLDIHIADRQEVESKMVVRKIDNQVLDIQIADRQEVESKMVVRKIDNQVLDIQIADRQEVDSQMVIRKIRITIKCSAVVITITVRRMTVKCYPVYMRCSCRRRRSSVCLCGSDSCSDVSATTPHHITTISNVPPFPDIT